MVTATINDGGDVDGFSGFLDPEVDKIILNGHLMNTEVVQRFFFCQCKAVWKL